MGWLIFSICLAVGSFVLLGFSPKENANLSLSAYGSGFSMKWGFKKRQALAILAFLFVIPGFFAWIPANTVGILYSPFEGTREMTLDEGVSSKNLFDKVYTINTETQTMTLEGLTTQTKDAQYVISTLDIKYKVNAKDAFLIFKQYRTLKNMSESMISPTTQKVLELVTTRYNVIDVLGEGKASVYAELDTLLAEEFAKYGVEFISISIVDMNAGEAIEAAIEAEAVAKKAAETAEQDLIRIETEAKQKSVLAQAEQDAAVIAAETLVIQAEAEKEANKLLQESLNEDILMQEWIKKWNGSVPQYYGGEGADLIFNTGNIQ